MHMAAPGGKHTDIECLNEQSEEGQAHVHVAGILLEEQHGGAAPDLAVLPALGVQHPGVQLGAVLGFQ